LAAVQRGTEWQKLTTMFYSFASHFYNRQIKIMRDAGDAGRSIANGDVAQGTQDMAHVISRGWWYFAAPMLIHAVIKGQTPGDDESWLGWAAEEVGMGMVFGVPILRDVAKSAVEGRDYQLTPVEHAVTSLIRTGRDIRAVASGDDAKKRWLLRGLETAGYTFGLPLGQVGTTAQYLYDIMDGEQEPENIFDLMKGVAAGPPNKHH
jgi:hypothetical protein